MDGEDRAMPFQTLAAIKATTCRLSNTRAPQTPADPNRHYRGYLNEVLINNNLQDISPNADADTRSWDGRYFSSMVSFRFKNFIFRDYRSTNAVYCQIYRHVFSLSRDVATGQWKFDVSLGIRTYKEINTRPGDGIKIYYEITPQRGGGVIRVPSSSGGALIHAEIPVPPPGSTPADNMIYPITGSALTGLQASGTRPEADIKSIRWDLTAEVAWRDDGIELP
jgi:hypothetical protein